MAETHGQSQEQIALQRLLSADADAQAALDNAHLQTTKAFADGKAAAQRLIEQTRAAAEAEAKTQRQGAHTQLMVEVEQMHEQAQQDVAAMRLRPQGQLAAAVQLVLAWVKAEA